MKVFSAKTCTNVKSGVRSMEIEASDRERAAKLAKIKFCETEKLKNWPLLRIAFTYGGRVSVLEIQYERRSNLDLSVITRARRRRGRCPS